MSERVDAEVVDESRYSHWVDNLAEWDDMDELAWVRGTAADRDDREMFRAANERMDDVRGNDE